MIIVDGFITSTREGNVLHMKRTGGRAELPTRHAERSIDFYLRVFGLRPIDGGRVQDDESVVLGSVPHGIELVLRPSKSPGPSACFSAARCGLRVSDLDVVRQIVWDLGIKVVYHGEAPDQIYRWHGGRSLYIHDPDGNELELLEVSTSAGRPGRRTEGSSRGGQPVGWTAEYREQRVER